MSEEITRARFMEVEAQMNQMTDLIKEMETSQNEQLASMVAVMKAMILNSQATSSDPVVTDPANPVVAEECKKEPTTEEKPCQEDLALETTSVTVVTEGSKGKCDQMKAKDALRLAKIEECLARQGYELE